MYLRVEMRKIKKILKQPQEMRFRERTLLRVLSFKAASKILIKVVQGKLWMKGQFSKARKISKIKMKLDLLTEEKSLLKKICRGQKVKKKSN